MPPVVAVMVMIVTDEDAAIEQEHCQQRNEQIAFHLQPTFHLNHSPSHARLNTCVTMYSIVKEHGMDYFTDTEGFGQFRGRKFKMHHAPVGRCDSELPLRKY
jgi:hypothetical protein